MSAFANGCLFNAGALITEPQPVTPVAAYPYLHGWRRTYEGASLIQYSSAPSANDPYIGAFRHTHLGARYCTTAAVSATTRRVGGIAISATGQMHITFTLPSPAYSVGAFTVDKDGVVYCADSMSLLGFMTEFYDGLQGVTVTGAGASQWDPIVYATAHPFTQGTDANRPPYANGALTFDGANYFIQTGALTLNQAFAMFVVFTPTAWANNARIVNSGSTLLTQTGLTPQIAPYAGSFGTVYSATLSTKIVVGVQFNGASSFYKVNQLASVTGDLGANNGGQIALGSDIGGANKFTGTINGFGIASGVLTEAQFVQTNASMMRRYGI